MRKLKQWEEEKRVLEEGLKIITGACEWYNSRLKSVNERLKFGCDPSSSPAATTEATQVRIFIPPLTEIRVWEKKLTTASDAVFGWEFIV